MLFVEFFSSDSLYSSHFGAHHEGFSDHLQSKLQRLLFDQLLLESLEAIRNLASEIDSELSYEADPTSALIGAPSSDLPPNTRSLLCDQGIAPTRGGDLTIRCRPRIVTNLLSELPFYRTEISPPSSSLTPISQFPSPKITRLPPPPLPSSMAQPSPLVSLPLHSKRGVPKWDDADHDSVERYFEDL